MTITTHFKPDTITSQFLFYSDGNMPANKENAGRSGRKKEQLSRMDGEKYEDYITRREKNNQAVRRSRDKSKKKTEETLMRVDSLKKENLRLEEQIRGYQKQLSDLKEIFLAHAGPGNVNMNIDIDALLRDSDAEAEESSSSQMILGP